MPENGRLNGSQERGEKGYVWTLKMEFSGFPDFGLCRGRGGSQNLNISYPSRGPIFGRHPGDHNHQDFPKSTAIQMRGVRNTHGRRAAIQVGGVLTVVPFPQSIGAPKVLQYKLEVHCNTNWRRIAKLF